jgi:hypothetical protein
MEKTNQKKRKGRKSSVEKIYLSGEKIIEIIEISREYGKYPFCSVFSYQHSLDYIYRNYNFYRWKLEKRIRNKQNGMLEYGISTTTRNNRIYNQLLVIELEEEFVVKLIEELNS